MSSNPISDPAQTDPVDAAAAWLACEKRPPHPIVPTLQRRFSLTPAQAVAAIRASNLIRARAT